MVLEMADESPVPGVSVKNPNALRIVLAVGQPLNDVVHIFVFLGQR
jgi:hypothetical protein